MVICESIYMQIPLKKTATKRNRPQESIFILAYNNCDEKTLSAVNQEYHLHNPWWVYNTQTHTQRTELENRQSRGKKTKTLNCVTYKNILEDKSAFLLFSKKSWNGFVWNGWELFFVIVITWRFCIKFMAWNRLSENSIFSRWVNV